MNLRRISQAVAGTGALTASVLTAHTAINMRMIRRPRDEAVTIDERVSVLLPARDEANRITPTLRALLAQEGLPNLEILVLDDGSTDGTGDVVRQVVGTDPRVKVIDGPDDPPPPGWLGKSWACHRLSQEATGDVLVFVDADVDLTPRAIASTIHHMREAGLDLLSPYPRQVAVTPAERITQPLIVWSWVTALPIRITERSHYPSMAAAIGQFLVVDARAYRISGGHTAVADMIIEDVGVLRALKRHGFKGAPADGSAVASCRMYESADDIYAGYTKSVWSVFQPAIAAYGLAGVMVGAYVAPPIFALVGPGRRTRMWGLTGYGAGVLGRYVVARRTGEHVWPDVFAQPLSMAVFAGLIVESIRRHRAGTLTWRGRAIP
ncbi:MAG: glycosyltransferase [Actinobacteria bacterium]|nr:glycosyltransferase [Actinomycetota bacterium]